ncbi:MAG: BamA/TamA family outer membrane protein [Pseudomonadota bacterium]
MRWGALAAGLCVALALTGNVAAADDKRALPDYGNRGKDPNTPGQDALWVPRILLSPLYLVTEYGVRWPIGRLISAAERANLPDILYNFFFFGPDHSAGIAPVAFVDFGFQPSVGLYGFWDNALAQGNDLRFHGTTGGSAWFAGVLTDRVRFHNEDSIGVTLTGIRRPDQAFFGTGPDALQDDISRYGESRLGAQLDTDFRLWRASRIETNIALRSLDFHRGYYEYDPSIERQAARGVYPLPDGFTHGYTAQTNHVRAALDNRLPAPADGSGFRLEADVEQGTDVRRAGGASWLKYAGTAGAFWDVNGRNRVLSLSVTAQFAESLNHRPIPFTELVTLGGAGPMRGFYPGRLRDRSAAVLTAKYRWPIWVWLDGSLQAAVGNVYGEHLQQLELSRSRFSAAIGFESIGSRDGSFELLAGLGTETFEHGGQVTSGRLLLGTNRGF